MTKIETRRLVLRAWEDEDAAALFELASDPEVGPRAGWPAHASETESLQIIRNVLRGDESYAVALRNADGDEASDGTPADTLVGAIALKASEDSRFITAPSEYEIGYWVGRPYWGRGYAPEAMEALIEHAQRDLGATAIWAGYYAGNMQSRRVMEKCGLTHVRTDRSVDVPLLGETRDEDVLRLELA